MGAVVALAGATLASPFIVKDNALAKLAGRDSKAAPAMEQVVAGGFQYAMPASWGQIGAESAEANADDQATGTVVGGVCPGGSAGATCDGDVQITFVAYNGEHGKLPLPTTFEETLDGALPKRVAGFHKVDSATAPSADGTTWLRYEFTLGTAAARRHEVLGEFRHSDGSGVVAVAVGPRAAIQRHRDGIVEFLASAEDVA
jgi:hypothetical protein